MTKMWSAAGVPPLPGMIAVRVWAFNCHRCGHTWLPREERGPKICPTCKSPYWDRPRGSKRAGTGR